MEIIRKRLEMSKNEFSLALGFVTTGGYEVSTRDGGSLQLLLAAEGVEKRYGKTELSPMMLRHFLLIIQSDGNMNITPVDQPDSIKISGRDYWLVLR